MIPFFVDCVTTILNVNIFFLSIILDKNVIK